MTAEIFILPIVRVESATSDIIALSVKLNRHNHARLTRLAAKWQVPVEEAAAMMLSDLLDTR